MEVEGVADDRLQRARKRSECLRQQTEQKEAGGWGDIRCGWQSADGDDLGTARNRSAGVSINIDQHGPVIVCRLPQARLRKSERAGVRLSRCRWIRGMAQRSLEP